MGGGQQLLVIKRTRIFVEKDKSTTRTAEASQMKDAGSGSMSYQRYMIRAHILRHIQYAIAIDANNRSMDYF